MTRTKRTPLPPITPADHIEHPEKLRRTPTGWAWRCAHCRKFASSQTLAGAYVCRDHGGTTPAQRSPEAQAKAKREGRKVPRPPGRPLTTGFYSKRPKVKVDTLVTAFEEQQLDPDNTDDDMLYLRAYLDEMRRLWPGVDHLHDPLTELLDATHDFATTPVIDADGATVETVIDQLGRSKEWTDLARTVQGLLDGVDTFTKDLEHRHARLIQLSKIRSETRLKNAAARQVNVFTLMVRRFMVILEEQLSPGDYEALQRRIEKDLEEVSEGLLTGASSVKA